MIALSYQPPLVEGRLVSRYQRFFADVELAGGLGTVTAHCPNPGSMASCMEIGGRVWVQRKTGGKLDWGWELAEVGGVMISVNPTRSNALVAAALEANAIPELSGYGKVRREADAGLGLAFIAAARGMMAPDGVLWLVANRHLPYDAALTAAFLEVETIGGDGAFRVIRAARPRRLRP